MSTRYLAVPATKPSGRTVWCVYLLPIGNSTRATSEHPGPFGKFRARRKAARLNRRGR